MKLRIGLVRQVVASDAGQGQGLDWLGLRGCFGEGTASGASSKGGLGQATTSAGRPEPLRPTSLGPFCPQNGLAGLGIFGITLCGKRRQSLLAPGRRLFLGVL